MRTGLVIMADLTLMISFLTSIVCTTQAESWMPQVEFTDKYTFTMQTGTDAMKKTQNPKNQKTEKGNNNDKKILSNFS